MQSKATSVEAYLAELPQERRKAVRALREVILKNLDKDYEEGMQYGMIGYYVPHRIFPAGYHCDPRQPLPFAGIGAQKNHISLYLGCVYGSPDEVEWFRKAWDAEVAKGRAKKLDMGRACVRIKKLEDVPLNVVGQAIKRIPVKKYVAAYEATRAETAPRATAGAGERSAPGGKAKTAKKAKATGSRKASPAPTRKLSPARGAKAGARSGSSASKKASAPAKRPKR